MLRINHLSRIVPLGLALTTLALYTGCIIIPSEASELQGTWALTTAQSTNLGQTLLTFNEEGALTSVSYTIAGVTITDHAVTASSHVTGNNVTITASFAGNSINFVGTFNADKTVITGDAGTTITIGGITISIDNGAVTLTKQ